MTDVSGNNLQPPPGAKRLPHEIERDLVAYARYVEEMATKADGTIILNHSRAHAEVVIAQLFKSANSDVRILTGHLANEVYGSVRVRAAARSFASRNPAARVRIISELDIGSNDLIRDLSETLGPRLGVRRIKKDIGNKAHFAVSDTSHFRLEADKDKSEAVVAFGNEEVSQRLASIFDGLYKLAEAS